MAPKKRVLEQGSSSNPAAQPEQKKQKANEWIIPEEYRMVDVRLTVTLSELTMNDLGAEYGRQWYMVHANMLDTPISGELFGRILTNQMDDEHLFKVKAADEPGTVIIQFEDARGYDDNPAAQELNEEYMNWKGNGVFLQMVRAVQRPEVDPSEMEVTAVAHHTTELVPVELELSMLTMLHMDQNYGLEQQNLVYSIMPDAPMTPELICRCLLHHRFPDGQAEVFARDVNGAVIIKFKRAELAERLKNTTWIRGTYQFSFQGISKIIRYKETDPMEYEIHSLKNDD